MLIHGTIFKPKLFSYLVLKRQSNVKEEHFRVSSRSRDQVIQDKYASDLLS